MGIMGIVSSIMVALLAATFGAWINNVFTWKIKDKVDVLDVLSEKLLDVNYSLNKFLEQIKLWNEKRQKYNANNMPFEIFRNSSIYRKISGRDFRLMIDRQPGIYRREELGRADYCIVQKEHSLPIHVSPRRYDRLEKIPDNQVLQYNDIIELFSSYNYEDFCKDCNTITHKLKQIEYDRWKNINELYIYNKFIKEEFKDLIEEYERVINSLTLNMTNDIIGNSIYGNLNYMESFFISSFDLNKLKQHLNNTTDGIYRTMDGEYYQIFNHDILIKLEFIDNEHNLSKFENNSTLGVFETHKLFKNYQKKSFFDRFQSEGNPMGRKKYMETFNKLQGGLISYREKLTSFNYMFYQLCRIDELKSFLKKCFS